MFLGACRIFKHKITEHYPPVNRLACHLPDRQQIIYQESDNKTTLRKKMERQKLTKLTEYMETVSRELESPLTPEQRGTDPKTGKLFPPAPELSYLQFPSFYVWDKVNHTWDRRAGGKCAKAVGRVFMASPKEGERYYLRILLHKLKGL